MNDNGGITIITAPNGYGKSTLLKIINDVFNGRYDSLLSTNFKTISIQTENSLLEISKISDGEKTNRKYSLVFEIMSSEPTNEVKSYKYPKNTRQHYDDLRSNEDIDFSPMMLEREIARNYPFLRRVSQYEWRDERSGETFSRNEIIHRFNNNAFKDRHEPEWLNDFRKGLRVVHISANRLRADLEPSTRVPRHMRSELMVDKIAENISENMRGALREYALVGRGYEQTFPGRIMDLLNDKSSNIKLFEINNIYNEIRNRENVYQKLGLIESSTAAFPDININDSSAILVMGTFLDDICKKFESLEDISNKLSLFVDTLNDLLIFKRLKPSLDSGFLVVGDDGESISLSSLSSGEQHLIVLLGELIFGSSQGALVLLDEPEISFHPEWQEKFPLVIEKIVEINQCSVVMATHSPTLVQNNWESVIELADQVAS